MDDSATTGAMTEIALALAMAFFCILVLALVSMGNPTAGPAGVGAIDVGPIGLGPRLATVDGGSATRAVGGDETLVLFHAGRFLDRTGAPLDPAFMMAGPVVLAIDPALPLDRVLAARAVLAGVDVTVTPLDPAWTAHLTAGGSR